MIFSTFFIFRLKGGYEFLNSIDSAFCLITLTGGLVLRLNPTHLNDRKEIISHLKEFKEKNIFIGVAGCELIKVNKIISKNSFRNYIFVYISGNRWATSYNC